MFRTAKEYLDYLIKLDYDAEEIICVFEYRDNYLTKEFHKLIMNDKKYKFIKNKRKQKNIDKFLKKIENPIEYFNKHNVVERCLTKEYWYNRVKKYYNYLERNGEENLEWKNVWDIYMSNVKGCEDEMFYSLMEELGIEVPEDEYKEKSFWVVENSKFRRRYKDDFEVETEQKGISAYEILIDDLINNDEDTEDTDNGSNSYDFTNVDDNI